MFRKGTYYSIDQVCRHQKQDSNHCWRIIWFGIIWASLRNHLADSMCHLGYKSCLADPDLWYKPEIREEDKFKYYSYVLLYLDDCLCIHHSAEEELNKIDKFFKMKAGSIRDLDIYLGAKVKPMKMNNGMTAWAISLSKYVNEAVNNCEK